MITFQGLSAYLTRVALLVVKTINIMAKIKKEKKVYLPTDIISFPVYMPFAKYTAFKELCDTKRMPMTKIAEGEIDKFISRNR